MKVVANSTHNIAVQKGKLLSAFTNAGSQGSVDTFLLSGTGYAANEQLIDVLSCSKLSADSSGNVNLAFKGGNPQASLLESFLASRSH
jgi:alpha-amylase